MPLTLEASKATVMKWLVDASFATHPDMRSHTGGVMTLGRGAIYSVSTRQKLNTRSSTEGELVGVSDVMPQILWTRRFLECQGYRASDSIIYQDNQSCILMAKNGRGSSSKRTRHIDIRYFFVTDRIAAGDVTVEYCPTGDMIADFFTKPLQGTPFRRFRDMIMNVEMNSTTEPMANPRSVLKMEHHHGLANTNNACGNDSVSTVGLKHTTMTNVSDYGDLGIEGWIPVRHKERCGSGRKYVVDDVRGPVGEVT